MARRSLPWAKATCIALAVTVPMTMSQESAAQASDQEERNRALIADRFEAWRTGSGSPYELLADDAVWTIVGNSAASRSYPSKEAFLADVIRPFNARMQDRLVPTVHRIYADGDTVVAHFSATGTARDGKPYNNSYAWILRMSEGQIVEAYAYFDALEFNDFWSRVSPASER